ncbi:trypsin-like serine protease, partial [Jatrophihabitans sp.]|uniref:trypsin-like serine protease n=1 Tax=Jatrophihabitans sp. TaxID=1932789 RepID=UPI002EDDB111
PDHSVTNMAEVAEQGNRTACHGDSGGPVYAGNRGVGLVEAADIYTRGPDAPNGQTCYYVWYYVSLSSALNDMHVHLVAP